MDECLEDGICDQNQECVNRQGGFECVCAQGYEAFQNQCVDIKNMF